MTIGLGSGATGPEVGRLHRVLEAAGLAIEADEREHEEFGASTLEALHAFHRQHGLPVRDEVDEETFATLVLVEERDAGGDGGTGEKQPQPAPASRGTVRVSLVDEDGKPLARVRVALFAQAVRGEQQVGNATTDAVGKCVIGYARPRPLNLVVRAHDETLKVIAQSATNFAAAQQVRIPVTTAADGVLRAPSVYTNLVAAVAAELEDVTLTSLRETTQVHELSFLASAVGVPFSDVAFLYVAQVLGTQHGVRDQTFFGIFYQGTPPSLRAALANLPEAGIDDAFTAQVLDGVLAHSRDSLALALTGAVTAGILPASYSPVQAAELTLLDGLRVKSVTGTPYVRGKTSLSDLLAAGGVSQTVQTAFTTALADNNGHLGPTWKALRANGNLSAADLAALETTLSAGELLTGSIPLVRDTVSRIADRTLANVQMLALLDENDWVTRITSVDPTGASLPAGPSGESQQDRIVRFAKVLTARFAARYPTTAFAGGLDKADASSFARSKEAIVSFLVNHPAFAFERTNIDHYLHTNNVEVPEAAVTDLKTAQRLSRITPHYATVDALKAAGHESAQSVYFKGQDAFIAETTGIFGSAMAAKRAYARAHMNYATALSAFAKYSGTFNTPNLGLYGPTQPSPDEVNGLPDLQTLFGSLDYFQCEDCQSIYSPAAYLVDLLQYLSGFTANGVPGGGTAREALLQRRPDLENIALDCANTNITLPYIDVVNELLEAVVAPPGGAPVPIDTTGTSAERRALPQQVSQAAYDKTAAQVFPLSLPFDLPFTQTQAYIAGIGTTRASLLALFAGNPVAAGSAPGIAAARLGISPAMREVITGADASQEWDRWGLEENPAFVIDPLTRKPYPANPADWVAALSKVPVLLDRAGLTLRELYQLLDVDWVTESGVTLQVGTTTFGGVQVLSPSTEDMTFTGLTADVLDRANRFLRLWKASGLRMWELDWALGASALNDDFLVFLADALTVRDRLGLPFQEVLSFWMNLETRDVTSHLGDEDTVIPATYTEVFRNPAVLASAADVFVSLAGGGALSGNPIIGANPAAPPTAELNAVTAALGLSGNDVTAICDATGTAATMSLGTLNVLLRYQRLARSLSLEIPSLISWIQLTGGQPFGAAPSDTMEFCRRLGVLQRTGLGVYDLDYLLRHKSADRTALAFTDTQATAVLQAIRDAVAKLPSAVVSPAVSAAIQTIFLAALAAATASTADVVGPVLLGTGVLPLNQATVDLLLGETNGVDPTQFPALINAFTTVAKAVALYTALRPGMTAFGFAGQAAGSYGWLNPAALPVAAVDASPYAGFESLLTAFRLNRRQPGRGPRLFDVLGQWLPPGAVPPDVPTAVTALAPALNASVADVQALTTKLGASTPALAQPERAGSLADPEMLGAIAAALDVVTQYRLSGTILAQLAAEPAVAATALAARAAVQAQYGQVDWLRAIQPVEDRLRETRRDALVGYLLGPGQAGSQQPLQTTDDLYNYYLIDPEMSSCALTTRLLEGSLAVQQFVQQCFLNLTLSIDGVTVDTADPSWDEWSWRQQFRLWQAARKVFCYPENYLLPELRRDASPFFTDLGNDMRQSDYTAAAAETAIGNYLRKLLSVANLTVAAHYSEGPRTDGSYVLHVFAHTGGTPDQWYYRARTGGTPDTGSWSPWQPLNLDIASQHLLPVIWDQRLYLVWPIFRQISEKQANQPVPASGGGNTQSSPPRKFWSVEIAMSHLSAGQWQPKQVLPQKVYWNTTGSPLAFVFRGTQSSSFDLWLSAFLFEADGAVAEAMYSAENDVHDQLKGHENDPSFTGTPAQVSQSWGNYMATVQLTWSGSTPLYTVTAANGPTGQVTTATLLMPESPLAVTEYTYLLPGSQFIDLSQDPTYPLITTSDLFAYRTPMAMPTGYGPAGQALVYGSYLTRPPAQPVPLNVLAASSTSGPPTTLPLLNTITNPTIVPPVQEGVFDSTLPFFVADPIRTYLVQPSFYTLSSYPYATEIANITSYPGNWATKYTFLSFYHPYARTFLRELEIGGVPQLMSRDLQLDPQKTRGWTPKFDFGALYSPRPPVSQPYPGANGAQDPGESALDFAVADAAAYSEYNWELFYHIPMFLASLLLPNKKFQDTLNFLEYILNPTDSSNGATPQRFWQFAPFNVMNADTWVAEQIQNLLTTLAADKQQGISDTATASAIQNWIADPYDPHAVASVRIAAYGKATVMRFLDTLIAWGDWYYSQYTAEMVGYAEQLYVFADMLLGPRPQSPRKPAGGAAAPPPTYASLKNLDLFSNALVPVENLVIAPEPPGSVVNATAKHPSLPQLPGGGDANALLFCIPPNPQLLAYWDTVAQRLDNIRHCRNLQGQPQPLRLYAPEINPLSLIEGQGGADAEAAGAGFAPVYRFNVYLQRAVELANDVRAYGALILSALEKQDAEALAAMRAGQELDMQTKMSDVKAEQVTEAQDQVTALQNQQAVVQTRYNYYSNVAFMNAWEIAAIALQGAALIANGIGVVLDITSGTTSLIPTINVGVAGFGGTPTVTASFGGDNVSKAATSWASVARGIGGILSEAGGMAATMGTYQRRMDDWNLQASLASAELTQVGSQITAAQDRVTIAQKEQSIATKQVANAQTVSDFLTSKYTNAQLYNWMGTQLTTVYTQAYQLAYSYAQQAQNAYNYELGKLAPSDQETFVQFGYWDSQHQGLTAGESLLFDLRRMEARYLASNTRELELTKHISLVLTSPVELVKLRETGSCQIALHEALFEYDHPGHYARRLRSVAVTIPCVTGPYTGVNATLSLTSAMVRTAAAGNSYQPQPADAGPLNNQPVILSPVTAAGTQIIATSSGQQDAGLFEVNLRDERWLPFEGQGAISTWNLTLDPRDNNFDFTTITDVILHVRYTARDGGADAAGFVRDELKPSDPRTILVSARNTLSGAWYAFLNPGPQATEQTLTLPLNADVFPYTNLGNGTAEIQALALYAVLSVPADGNTIAASLTGAGPEKQISLAPMQDPTTSGDPAMALSATGITFAPTLAAPQTLNLTIPLADIPDGLGATVDERTVLDPDKVEDVLLVITYSIG